MDALSSAYSAGLYGMRAATSKFARASEKEVQATSGASNDNPDEAVVEQIESEAAFKANAKTISIADQMIGTLLDIKV